MLPFKAAYRDADFADRWRVDMMLRLHECEGKLPCNAQMTMTQQAVH